jgi:hypothetical protein
MNYEGTGHAQKDNASCKERAKLDLYSDQG